MGCLLLPVILAIVVILIYIFVANMSYGPPLHQSHEHISKIELLDTHTHDEVLLYTLEDSEIAEFINKLDSVVFHRYVNDPQTHYGAVAVKITYQDGWYDILGMHINRYCTPEGKNTAADGWYYLSNKEDFITIFSQYVDEEKVPTEMIDAAE